MNHNDIRHKLSEYIDNTLTPEQKASVEVHLKACPACSNALVELQKTVEHIKGMEEVEPPAWMARKIMARTRAEEEKKKLGLFRRMFFPLHIKLPLETVGVLFIAMTVYFVVQEMQRTTQHLPEAPPVQTYAPKSSPKDNGAPKENRAAKPEHSLQRHKEVPQEPEYKALDMKPAYEGPKPPAPAPAPEPPKPAEEQRALQEELSQSKKSTDQAARGFMQHQAQTEEFPEQATASRAPAAAMARRKSESFAPDDKRAAIAPAEMGNGQMTTLAVSDVSQAAAWVENAAREYGGKILKRESIDAALSLIVAIDTGNRNRFIDRLKTMGELKGREAGEIRGQETVIEIRIVKKARQN